MNGIWYFPHEIKTVTNSDILNCLLDHGPSFYGVYWLAVELIAQEEEVNIDQSKLVKLCTHLLMTEKEKIETIIQSAITNGVFFLVESKIELKEEIKKSILHSRKLYEKKAESGRKGGKSKPVSSENEVSLEAKDEVCLKQNDVFAKSESAILLEHIRLDQIRSDQIRSDQKKEQEQSNTAQAQKDISEDNHPEKTATNKNESSSKKPKEKSKLEDKTPYQEILNIWNETFPDRPINELTEKMKRHISARWKNRPDINSWARLFCKVAESDFLSGRTGKFRASFTWLITNEDNPAKVMNDDYANPRKIELAISTDTGQKFRPTKQAQAIEAAKAFVARREAMDKEVEDREKGGL